jgi:hypothetical protein
MHAYTAHTSNMRVESRTFMWSSTPRLTGSTDTVVLYEVHAFLIQDIKFCDMLIRGWLHEASTNTTQTGSKIRNYSLHLTVGFDAQEATASRFDCLPCICVCNDCRGVSAHVIVYLVYVCAMIAEKRALTWLFTFYMYVRWLPKSERSRDCASCICA